MATNIFLIIPFLFLALVVRGSCQNLNLLTAVSLDHFLVEIAEFRCLGVHL